MVLLAHSIIKRIKPQKRSFACASKFRVLAFLGELSPAKCREQRGNPNVLTQLSHNIGARPAVRRGALRSFGFQKKDHADFLFTFLCCNKNDEQILLCLIRFLSGYDSAGTDTRDNLKKAVGAECVRPSFANRKFRECRRNKLQKRPLFMRAFGISSRFYNLALWTA